MEEKLTDKVEKNNRFTSPIDSSAKTIRGRVHELMGEGIIVKRFDTDCEIFQDYVSLENGFRCYKDGIECKADTEESAEEILKNEEFKEYSFKRYFLIPASGPDNEYVFEYYLPIDKLKEGKNSSD